MATKNSHTLTEKNILITAGPTWVELDDVRVITNHATGTTGILLTEELRKRKANVTLLLGPVEHTLHFEEGVRVLRFRFFEELRAALNKELTSRHYDAIIHTAAVSDFQPAVVSHGKTPSDLPEWQVTLKPTPKIIDSIKRTDPAVFLVGFKYEPRASRSGLLNEALLLMKRARLDAVVANTITDHSYEAHIAGCGPVQGPFTSKETLIKNLLNLMEAHI